MTKKKYSYRKVITGPDGRRYDVKANSELELGKKLAQTEIRMKEGGIQQIYTGNITLREWAEQCVETYKTNQNDVSRQKYWNRINHCILEDIGNMKLKTIRPINCQQVLNRQAGKSKTQINEVYQAFHFLFGHAVAEDLVPRDPTLSLIKPKSAKLVPRRALTPQERKYVIEVGLTDRRYYLFLLMLLCGCRPSEAVECRGDDIIENEGLYLLHIRGTKTKNADRYVPIPNPLLDVIKDTPSHEYIAQSNDGNKLERTARQRVWKSFKRALNLAMGCKVYRNKLIPPYPLAPDLVPYCFRHEYCTNLARHGVDIRKAQLMMGHSDITLTANIYTNLNSKDVAKDVAKALETVETGVETAV